MSASFGRRTVPACPAAAAAGSDGSRGWPCTRAAGAAQPARVRSRRPSGHGRRTVTNRGSHREKKRSRTCLGWLEEGRPCAPAARSRVGDALGSRARQRPCDGRGAGVAVLRGWLVGGRGAQAAGANATACAHIGDRGMEEVAEECGREGRVGGGSRRAGPRPPGPGWSSVLVRVHPVPATGRLMVSRACRSAFSPPASIR